MEFQVKVPDGLATRLENAAAASGKSLSELIVVAIAEKVAKLEHQQWLEESQRATGGLQDQGTVEADPPRPGSERFPNPDDKS